MRSENLHPNEWTFDEGKTAHAPDFTVSVPDGWWVQECDDPARDRAFRAYPASTTAEDVEECGEYAFDGLFFCQQALPIDNETSDLLEKTGIPETYRALTRMICDGDDNPMSKANIALRFVRASNCEAMVTLVDTNAGISAVFPELGGIGIGTEVGYDIEIWPICPIGPGYGYVRLYCPNQPAGDAKTAMDAACELATTIELIRPIESDLTKNIESLGTDRVTGDFFAETTASLCNALFLARQLEKSPALEGIVRRAAAQGQGDMSSAIKAYLGYHSDFNERTQHYAFELLDDYDKQRDLGATGEDLEKMASAIGDFMQLYETRLKQNDSEQQDIIDREGNIKSPSGYLELRDRIEEIDPGYKERHPAPGEMEVPAIVEARDDENRQRETSEASTSKPRFAKREEMPSTLSKTTLDNKLLIENVIVPYVIEHEPVKAKHLAGAIDGVSTPQRAGALLGRAVAMGLLSSCPYAEKLGKSYGSPNAIWSAEGEISGHKPKYEVENAPSTSSAVNTRPDNNTKEQDAVAEPQYTEQMMNDLMEKTVVPYVLRNGPVKASDLIRNIDGIATPKTAGALLGRAVGRGLLSSPPFVEKGGKSYAGPDFDWWAYKRGEPQTPASKSVSQQKTSTGTSSSGGCYIATAVYGSYDCPEVWTLRRYRDYELAQSISGRLFIKLYYAISPKVVAVAGNAVWFQDLVKPRLDSMVARLQSRGYESTPYRDRDWS